jgi:hypothetical protein
VPAYRSIVLSILKESESYLGVLAKNSRRATKTPQSDLSHLFTDGSLELVEKWILSKTDLGPSHFSVTTRFGQGALLSQQDGNGIPGHPTCGCSEGNCHCPRLCTYECTFCHRWCLGKEPDGSPCQRVPLPGHAYCRRCTGQKSTLQVCQTPGCRTPSPGYTHCWRCRNEKSSLQVGKTPGCGRSAAGRNYCRRCTGQKGSRQVYQTPGCERPSRGSTHCKPCRGKKNKTLDCEVEGCTRKRCTGETSFCQQHRKEHDDWRGARGSSGGRTGGGGEIEDRRIHHPSPTPKPQGLDWSIKIRASHGRIETKCNRPNPPTLFRVGSGSGWAGAGDGRGDHGFKGGRWEVV